MICNACSFVILSYSAFNSDFVNNIATFLFKSTLFINPVIADLSTTSFCFIFASSF